jgi:hypothetical protein
VKVSRRRKAQLKVDCRRVRKLGIRERRSVDADIGRAHCRTRLMEYLKHTPRPGSGSDVKRKGLIRLNE